MLIYINLSMNYCGSIVFENEMLVDGFLLISLA
jgi:hypothetical protein